MSGRGSIAAFAVVLGVTALLVEGCRSEPAPGPRFPTSVSLLTLYPFTGHEAPTAVVLPGERPAPLLRGWGPGVRLADGESAAPVVDSVATIAFQAGPVPVDREVIVAGELAAPHEAGRVLPRPRSALPISVEVNDTRCRRVRTHDASGARWIVPAAVQRPGPNVLALRRPAGTRRRERSGQPLIQRIELRPRGPQVPRVERVDDRLVMPAGASITFYLSAPEAARLELGSSAGTAAPRVLLLADGATPRPLSSAASDRWAAPLDVQAHTVIGIRFEAVGPAVVVAPTVTGLARIERGAAATSPPPLRRPNVLLYVMDTLRADRLGCYGYRRDTSPAFDRFAREGIVFRHAVSHAPWTRPAVASILTGQLPAVHGAVGLRDRMRGDVPALAERFAAADYETAAFVTNTNVAGAFGFDRGFGRYQMFAEDTETPDVYVSAARLHADVLAWLDARASPRPFFLYVHASDVHAPYRPSADAHRRVVGAAGAPGDADSLRERMERRPDALSPADVRALSDLYDAEVATWDAAFGAFWEALRRRGLDRDTLVAFVADHGEEFHDHGGIEHGHTVYDELVRVPLVLRLPGAAGGGQVNDAMVQIVDLAPTLSALASVGTLGEPTRMPLVRADGSVVTRSAEPAFTSTQFDRREVLAMVLPPWKVILPPPQAGRSPEVYDLARDPGETRNVAAEHSALIGYAWQSLAASVRWSPPAPDVSAPPIAPEILERLRRLGYAVD